MTLGVSSMQQKLVGALEILCGSAVLTCELAKAGFHAVGLDAPWNKDAPLGPHIKIDLSQPGSWDFLLALIKENKAKSGAHSAAMRHRFESARDSDQEWPRPATS